MGYRRAMLGQQEFGALPRNPARRPIDPLRGSILDLRQRARPFEICPLVDPWGGPTRTLRGRRRPSPGINQNEWFQGPLPLAGIQGAAPLGGPGPLFAAQEGGALTLC